MHHAYTIAFLFILCCFFGYSIGKVYGFTILPDEFGYWSYAAAVAGYDWSDIVSRNSYYSFGYSVLLLPIFMLFQDGLTAYRVAVVVNFVLLAGMELMLQYLSGRLFTDRKEQLQYVCAAVAALYPPLLLYTKTTMAETMLAFLFVLILVLMYQYLEYGKTLSMFLMLLLFVYTHFVHMRAIALIVAGILTILVDRFFINAGKRDKHDRKQLKYVVAAIAAIILFILGVTLKDVILNHVFGGNSEHFQVNDYWGQFKKIKYIMTLDGLKNLMISVAGKILYLGTATFGIAFWGIWHAWTVVRNGNERRKRVFWLFVLLSVAGSLMLSAVYTVYPGRVDALAYGRYHEYVFPILIVAGLYEMWHTHRLWRGMILIAGVELCMLVPVLLSLHMYHQTSLHACMVFGMSYLYDVGELDPMGFYLVACGFGILLMTVVTAIIAVGHKMDNQMTMLLLIAVMEILLAIRASTAVTDAGSVGAYRDSVVADRITDLRKDQEARKVLYLSRKNNNEICRIQFLLRDTQITVLDRSGNVENYDEDEMSIWDLVLINYEDDYGEKLSKRYDYALASGHFILYYNRNP